VGDGGRSASGGDCTRSDAFDGKLHRIDETTPRGKLDFFDVGSDNTKPKLWKELGLVSVGEL
jgi:hypothetical protein